MSKQLCDLKKTLKDEPAKYARLVIGGTHYCEKCGRVANRKELVCRPVKLTKAVKK